MKSKIEKLEDNVLGDGITAGITVPDNRQLQEKINEIIDYLNSQAQPEKNNFVHTVGTPMLEGTTTCSQDTPEDTEHIKAHKEYLATSKQDTLGGKTLSDRIASAKPNSFIPVTEEEMKQLSNTQDTPEEWEDRIRDLILDISADRLVSSEKVVAIVQSLLDDREREVLEKMRDWVVEYTLGNFRVRDFDAEIAIGKIIDRELDKLNSKKK